MTGSLMSCLVVTIGVSLWIRNKSNCIFHYLYSTSYTRWSRLMLGIGKISWNIFYNIFGNVFRYILGLINITIDLAMFALYRMILNLWYLIPVDIVIWWRYSIFIKQCCCLITRRKSFCNRMNLTTVIWEFFHL